MHDETIDAEHRPSELGTVVARLEWAARALRARAAAWSSDRDLDPGDSHVKGEASLCVGEAA